ncbi:LuxR C-terminal-related transcriptional regulator [Lentzea sp. NPDC051208]|uniref:helix-turn-helix transcriptional regulator n=1 Tax=Lentzea sp. NPDC051208 TaxID=3154642 RepID=UPI00342CF6EE
MNGIIHRALEARCPTPSRTMLAETNADHTDSAAAHRSSGDGSPGLDSTAEEAVCALRRFLRAFAVAQLHEGGKETVPDELVRAAARLLQEATSIGQPSEGDPAEEVPFEDNWWTRRHARALSPLTGREKTVALLVVSGLTNREIADELVLSAKTVEFHLTNIYQKLHVKSRRELRRLLDLPR